MERKIGEIFEYEGVTLEVVKKNGCRGCYFQNKLCSSDINIYQSRGKCRNSRTDKNKVIFKLISDDIKSIFHRNYQAVIKRGLINSETTQADFEAKMLDEMDEVVLATELSHKAEEIADVMAVCASYLIHMGYDPIEVFTQVTEKNERRAANLESF